MSIIFKEIKKVIITLSILDVLILMVFYAILMLDKTVIIGLLFSNLYTLANFYLLGVITEKAVSMENPEKAKRYVMSNYFIRHIFTGIVIFVAFSFDYLNPVAVIIPLFAPKITYFCIGIFSILFRKDIK